MPIYLKQKMKSENDEIEMKSLKRVIVITYIINEANWG